MPEEQSHDAQQLALMREGTRAHQRCDYAGAERAYTATLALAPHAGASILLANAMLSRATAQASGLTTAERQDLRAASLPLARAALQGLEQRAPPQRVKLLARFAYYLLAYASLVKVEGCIHGAAAEAVLPPAPERAALLGEATAALQRVVALDPAYTLAWRNLALALTACARPAEAEAAMAAAVRSVAPPAAVPWELLYKHGKCLKRLGREAEALARYCDACEASQGREELPLFWLRVALAEGREGASSGGGGGSAAAASALLARCTALLARFSGGACTPALAPPPNAYIRKLFDGYSAHFDAHLVGVLGYATPARLRALALQALGQGAAWEHCADLGCGTGLAGLAFQGLVQRAMDGCDLSPGMVGEALKRGALYREVEAAEVVDWLRARSSRGVFYDLILSADVLVYLGGLEALFEGVAESLAGAAAAAAAAAAGGQGGAAARAPAAFLFSTEAMLGEEAEGATFELTATGRCRHSGAYIRRLASAVGLGVAAHSREVIRENAGQGVQGDLWLLTRCARVGQSASE